MSDVMLYGVLRMPYEMAMGSEMSRYQFYQRVQEAANRLEAAEAELAALKAQPAPTDAQGEDSARLDWLIENVSSGSIGFINGDFIGSQNFDELKDYIDRARASAETGGVKS